MKEQIPMLQGAPEAVHLGKPIGRHTLRFLAFLLVTALFVAAFAAGTMVRTDGEHAIGKRLSSFFSRNRGESPAESSGDGNTPDDARKSADIPDQSGESPTANAAACPEGCVPVLKTVLPAVEIQNGTPYSADVETVDWRLPDSGNAPAVLIVTTNAQEAYADGEVAWFSGAPGDETYSQDASRTVCAVAETLRRSLEENGIFAVCATVTGGGESLLGGSARAAERIEGMLRQYPEIQYVIDLRRDALIDGDGTYLRPIAAGCEKPTAQISAVVGTDCDGVPCPNWRENLALAEELGAALNQNGGSVFSSVSLRPSSYNQGLAPRSMLLKIGTGANTVEEASNAARAVGEALAELLRSDSSQP